MEWDRWKKLTVKVRLRIIYIYFIYIFHNQSVIVIIHYMTCKTLSDTDGQMDHGEAKLTANRFTCRACGPQQDRSWRSLAPCKHKMSIKGPVHAVISIVSPVDHWVLNLISGQRLDDLLDIPLRPPSLGEHQLYH